MNETESASDTGTIGNSSVVVGAVAAQRQTREDLERVVGFTKEIFPGELEIREEDDPEIPGVGYVVLSVTAQGSVEEVVARNDRWHRELRGSSLRRPELFRLSIDAQ